MPSSTSQRLHATLRLLLACAVAATAFESAGHADDRQLLRSGTGAPYVMVLFDTSGSMNWTPPCSAEDYAAGFCGYLCPSGDCAAPRNGDDPASKLRQAKEALYEVIQELPNEINFGFASFNQDSLRVHYKHWLYRFSDTQAADQFALNGGTLFPASGREEVFGPTYGCDQDGDNDDSDKGCYANNNDAADTGDLWEMTKVHRLPKLGYNQDQTIAYYVRDGGRVYYVRTSQPGAVTQTLGDATIQLQIELFRCTGTPADNPSNLCNASSERTLVGTRTYNYDLIGDFVKWENSINRNSPQGYDAVAFSNAGDTCGGWDPNSDDTDDPYSGYSLRFPDSGSFPFNPPGTTNDWRFEIGDVLPLFWGSNNRLEVLERLAPRLVDVGAGIAGDPATDPEAFANATYLNHRRSGTQDYLRLVSTAERPLLPSGSTPLGAMLGNMRTWFHGCNSTNCSGGAIGWGTFAAQNDADYQCRGKYILLLTDGDETCGGSPDTIAGALNDEDGVLTFVIGFGLPSGGGNTLEDIAEEGGTGEPFFPRNKDELVAALRSIFVRIQEDAASFASAAVPTVQANVADKIYLSSFTPLNEEAIWPGRLDAFLKPLPLDAANLPDRTAVCIPGTLEAECFAWDAGDSQLAWDGESGYDPQGLLLQAPLASEMARFDNSTLRVGTGVDERRIYFGLPASTSAGKRQLFRYPTTTAEQAEFEFVWNVPNPIGTGDAANLAEIADVVEFTLAEKQGAVDVNDTPADPDDDQHIQYLLGDVFHSNPAVLNPPADFDFFTKDLYYNTPLCGQDLATTRLRGPQISYNWFSNKNLCRRIMLFVGSDDGQLHAFDAGIFRGTDCRLNLPGSPYPQDPTLDDSSDINEPINGLYDYGSGRELFSFIPSAQMPLIQELTDITELDDQYGIDGSPRLADVFIDPLLDNTGNPTCTEREWRTVLLGTYREGGPGLFALDVTQPDTIDAASNVPQPDPGSPSYVPSCASGGTGCGTLPFPSLLWEFVDTTDEDGVGGADMAESWSVPVVARIRVCEGACDQPNEPEDRFVAIFGGGLSEFPTESTSDDVGNWLYMLDVETGRVLYKRGGDGVISGALAADVTVVDANSNGLVDTFYFGTTAGYLYKVALGEGPFELDGSGRIVDPTGDAGRYNPFVVFTTGGRPIYLEAAAVNVPQLRANALLFGTGSRWDLWKFNDQEARFYAIVDTGWVDTDRDGILEDMCGPCTQPLTELSYELIDPDSAFDIDNPGHSFLFSNPDPDLLPGWYFPMEPNDKLITEPFSLAGVTTFTMFSPISTESDGTCAQGGESKIFIVNTANAIGYAVDTENDNERVRYTIAPRFTTQPFAESSGTQNPAEGGGSNADQWTEALRQINNDLKKLYPPSARFGNYTIDIKTIRSDTGIVFVAPVPVAIEPHNWKEY